MKKHTYTFIFVITISLFISACSSMSIDNNVATKAKKDNTLLIYADGRMEYNSRFLNKEDVVIYDNGRGGENAAIKVRVPIHSDFYRDSITVVRVENQSDKSIAQEGAMDLSTATVN